jgi:hypothetical protein
MSCIHKLKSIILLGLLVLSSIRKLTGNLIIHISSVIDLRITMRVNSKMIKINSFLFMVISEELVIGGISCYILWV